MPASILASQQPAFTAQFSSAARAYFNAMTVQPDYNQQLRLAALIAGLQADGVYSLIDWLAVAGQDVQAALINMVNPAQIATANGTIPFTVNRGFVGDGSTGFLETGVTDTAAVNFTQNSASVFFYNNQASSSQKLIGLSGSLNTLLVGAGTGIATRVNSLVNLPGVAGGSLGLAAGIRTDAATMRTDRNGVQDAIDAANTSQAKTGGTFQVFRGNGIGGTGGRCAAFGFGAGLTAGQSLALYTRLNTYLTAIGAN